MCYSPMLAVKTGFVNLETGKPVYKFLGSIFKYANNITLGQLKSHGFIDQLKFDGQMFVDYSTGEVHTKPVLLPCGQCLECRCQHAQEWANRIMLESQYHEQSYFLTLTYDDEHIPCAESQSGDVVYTLDPKDLQDFIKRLRRSQEYHKENKIRFYAVGEYGSHFHRPHYHAIIFGLLLDDLKEVGKNKAGRILHDSEAIRRLWGKGITEVDIMTWETAAYCARYTTKKLAKAETDFYEKNGLLPEFSRMSLKPAIGFQYYEDHKDEIYKYDEIHISTSKGGRTVKPPHYYDKKYDDVYPANMAEVKGNRMDVAEKALVSRLDRFDGSYLELLALKEDKYKQRNKILRRNLE